MAGRGHARVQMLHDEIQKLMDMEERMWNQSEKLDWLKYGDQNTKYFHYWAMEKNKRNFISGLENEQGGWIEGEEHIGNLLSRYYSSLFSIANPTELDPVLNGVESRIWDAMNAELIKPFMATKVQCALKQMDSDSTRGPWEIIVYSWNTINACSLLSREWWAPLIKFMMGPIIHVRVKSCRVKSCLFHGVGWS